ncbi:dTDP-4-dehydrorhamnose reductase [Zhouia amylolytica]|uniref:dTDP-4-dehydrorhamnose reductase n=1 Tax=Zhouia amylolytica TaxID=376730 RepID=UPI0020CDDFD6|nr:dTDP-4-dehydrorhamnose reductase [Zhouia amylolytica]MCQ0112051.1 dTDP-4-dehydrorhamnose reductase [Zhouia amylolytica]
MSKIWVTGAAGQLGSEFKELAMQSSDTFIFTDRSELDITDQEAIEVFLEKHDVDVFINCAAYTAVDSAESEKELAYLINAKAVGYLAEACKRHAVKMIHISTDYVFDGEGGEPYQPMDELAPINEYGASKLAGERAMQEVNPTHSMIIRTSWVYSPYGKNFVKTMLRLGAEKERLKVVSDQFGSPTYARDLAEAILTILPNLNNEKVEVYHYSNEGVCSWHEFAIAIMELANLDCEVLPINTADFPTKAPRPGYSVLDTESIKQDFNINIPHWKDSLKSCLERLK